MATPAARDNGLRRVARITWGVVAGAVAATGVGAVAVARSLPGKSTAQRVSTTGTAGQNDEPVTTPPPSTPAAPNTPSPSTPSTAVPSAGTGRFGSNGGVRTRPLQPPVRPVRPSTGRGGAVSGGS